MSRLSHTRFPLPACLVALALLALALPATSAFAQPSSSERFAASALTPRTVEGTIGVTPVALRPAAPAISRDGSFTYTALFKLAKPADSVFSRLQVLNPSGKLMIQQTRIVNDADAGIVSASFSRDMSDLQLAPGAYPVTLEVQISGDGLPSRGILETDLLVYDPKVPALPIAFSARVSGQPLADPRGRFVADPARFTRARDDVDEVAAWILTEPDARLTLAISPLLLLEWQQIAGGYELATPEGSVEVPAGEPVPAAYAATLELLRQATATGRLELTRQGYADPNISALASQGMLADVVAQYERGATVEAASEEASVSSGTIPAGGCLPPAAATSLASQGITYAVVEQSCAQHKNAKAPPGVYRVRGEALRIVVADDALCKAITDSNPTAQIEHAFERAGAGGGRGALVVVCDLGPGASSVRQLVEGYDNLSAQPWLRSQLVSEVAARAPRSTVQLSSSRGDASPPAGYWAAVARSRAWAKALASALGSQDPLAKTAENDSLIAQCSAWAGVDALWALADRGLSFASAATRSAEEVLKVVDLQAQRMTLAGNAGEIPLTITNAGERPLTVDIIATPSSGLLLASGPRQRVQLSPQDNLVTVPVSMPEAWSSKLTVTVSSGGTVLDRTTIDVRASYLDRVVMIGGVGILLLGMLVFIVRRVRSAEERTTDSTADDDWVSPR